MNIESVPFRVPSRLMVAGGMGLMIAGMLALAAPFISGVAASGLVAILVVSAGCTMAAFSFKDKFWGAGLAKLILGVLTIVIGVAMFMMPVVNLMALTALAIAYFIADGCISIYVTIDEYRHKYGSWGWSLFSSIVTLALAGILMYQFPASSFYAIGTLFGVRLVMGGISTVIAGVAGDQIVDSAEEVIQEELDKIEKDEVEVQPKAA
ncbi:MAG: hypothetical protein AseanaTS_04550 [Candidatus Pelagadaptatus aseana]|uniref:HdeD family acid-resistance protein n=1 Tax=Candidatus Pelagadaptatus aseana TaxID=3120508 RepID=UPI0039B1F36E